MNIFSVLGVHYEVFHTRMLQWLWSPDSNHGAGDRYLCAFLSELNLVAAEDCQIVAEAKTSASRGAAYRLVDLIIRLPGTLILVENKVDRDYQDIDQILDEIDAGRFLAEREGRKLTYVFVAPGPLSQGVQDALLSNGGRFVQWSKLTAILRSVPRDDLDPTIAAIIEQYFDFCDQPRRVDDPLLQECSEAIRTLVRAYAPGELVSADQLWVPFFDMLPEHGTKLKQRWAESLNYSAKAWFALRVQRMAAEGDMLEETGDWRKSSPEWGYPRVRVYRRLPTA